MNSNKVELRLESHQNYLNSIIRTEDIKRPNIILIFVDDMGYGDISCFDSKVLNTPNLDSLAQDGVKMVNFYASSPLCSPSRFGCLTGRYPIRGFVHEVFRPTNKARGRRLNRRNFPYGVRGILPDEVTFAESLQKSGYRTGIFGKWHLGDTSPYLPNENGFDYFFGSYYSNDMKPYAYYRNQDIAIEAPADQTKLTIEITKEVLSFIEENNKQPFLVYYASPFPHRPVHASPDFVGSSKGGTYGDCVQELDWSIGEIRNKLEILGLTENTLIIFTSDNGPWFEGSPGLHRGRKGNNFDGGHIVPMIASWPNNIPSGIEVTTAAMNIDFFPTLLNVAKVPIPTDREIDGVDIMPLLKGETKETPHGELYFVSGENLMGIRTNDNFKYHDKHKCENSFFSKKDQGPFLFDLNYDQDESYNVAMHYPDKTAIMRKKLESKRKELKTNPRGWKKI